MPSVYRYVRFCFGRVEEGKFEKLEAAVKAQGFRSVNQWVNYVADAAIAGNQSGHPSANPQPLERVTGSRDANLARLSSLEDRAKKLKAKIGQEYHAIREVYVEQGGDLRDLDNFNVVMPKVYKAYDGAVEKAELFEQYARLMMQIAELRKQLGIPVFRKK